MSDMSKVYEQLGDMESRRWYNARLSYAISHDISDIHRVIYETNPNYSGWDIAHLTKDYAKEKGIILFGTGKMGMHAFFILSHSELKDRIVAFADSNEALWGKIQNGLMIISPMELIEKYRNCIVVIASQIFGTDIYLALSRSGFPQENIYYPMYGRLTGGCGEQYFDMFLPVDNEVFIDAGCYDGMTSLQFVNWIKQSGKNKYKIIAFEPSKLMAEKCKENFSDNDIKDYELIEKACYSKRSLVPFVNDYASAIYGGSQVSEESNTMIATDTIDGILNGEMATFIKMDIEGSELEALIGAKKTIQKYRPRLAISLYHQYKDIIEIPAYIISLVPDYQLFIRHYSSDIWETVLYAI